MGDRYLSVTQLTQYIHRKFTHDPYLQVVYLRGEISNYNSRRNYQNQYFKLKDEHAVIQAIMFQNISKHLQFELEEGMSVLVRGRVDVYEPYGTYQIYVEEIQPEGIGNLFLAYEQTKKKLAAEGLFDPKYKKTLPIFPKKIGVITSASGAVIKDIQTTIARRYPIAQIYLFPTLVQGKKAAEDLEKNIKRAAAYPDLDLLIIARGGGSFEDLYPFSEEKVVRAIFETKRPIISAIGHETDLSLSELAADLRAPTPTAAAELATPRLLDIQETLNRHELQLEKNIRYLLDGYYNTLEKLSMSYIFKNPQRLYDTYIQRVDLITGQLQHQLNYILKENMAFYDYLNNRLTRAGDMLPIQFIYQNVINLEENLRQLSRQYRQIQNEKLRRLQDSLIMLSPYHVLERGYAIVEQNQRSIQMSSDLEIEQPFVVKFSMEDAIWAKQIKDNKNEGE
ncbi:exodeoxyribonuclease VII large subunit [Allofustis seminis]|uniref:exodeoxyribonuclease VII large subunit n=1 Tax=Allofustis seminis TaxID=166939 RepID=UPI00037DDF46|nr:exodeoxyribonuclease VII large subunit [Allofustis seminis]